MRREVEVSWAAVRRRCGLRDRLVVLAPHPDDESAGAGGLIARAARSGIRVQVVVLTDGAASHPNSRTHPPDRLAALRQRELKAALRRLGVVTAPVFLALPDGRSDRVPRATRDDAVRTLRRVIDRTRAQVIATPWRREPHCDHRMAFEVARDAVGDRPVRRLEYFVWTGATGGLRARPNDAEGRVMRMPLAGLRWRKRAALAAHASQLGLVVRDDRDGFALSKHDLAAMTGPHERYLVT